MGWLGSHNNLRIFLFSHDGWDGEPPEPPNFGRPGADPPNDPDYYYEIEMPPMLRLALLDVIRGKQVRYQARVALERLVMEARRVDRPFSRARLPWDEIEKEAQRQGIGPADVIWDRAKMKEDK